VIQLLVKQESDVIQNNNYYINLFDDMVSSDTTIYRPLQIITSQLTGKSKAFTGSIVETNKDRYIKLACVTSITGTTEDPTAGVIQVGTTDFPLGFYNITMYENTASNTNLDPTGLRVIYTGLVNLSGVNGADGITYSEYTTNDSDTESVYITF
jgi:hypothetical protein